MRQSLWRRFNGSQADTQVQIVCTVIVMAATVAYAVIAWRQLHAMNGQLTIMRDALAEAKSSGQETTNQMRSEIGNLNWMARSMDQSAKDTSAQMQAQSAAMQKSANAMENFAKSSKIAARIADKQREALQRQNDLIEQQGSAELVFQNFTVSEQPATRDQPEIREVSFDVVNVGGSAATQISEDAGGDVYHRRDEAIQATAGVAHIDPRGSSLDRGKWETIKIDISDWGKVRNRPRDGGDSYAWRRFTYLTFSHKAETACMLIVGHKGGADHIPCADVEPKQP